LAIQLDFIGRDRLGLAALVTAMGLALRLVVPRRRVARVTCRDGEAV
jgi:hypothetical protein